MRDTWRGSLLGVRFRLDLTQLEPALIGAAREEVLGHLVSPLDEDRVRGRQRGAGARRGDGRGMDDEVVGLERLSGEDHKRGHARGLAYDQELCRADHLDVRDGGVRY